MLKRLIQLILRPQKEPTKEDIRAAVERRIKSITGYGIDFEISGDIIVDAL